jgi:hypothetical protein
MSKIAVAREQLLSIADDIELGTLGRKQGARDIRSIVERLLNRKSSTPQPVVVPRLTICDYRVKHQFRFWSVQLIGYITSHAERLCLEAGMGRQSLDDSPRERMRTLYPEPILKIAVETSLRELRVAA